MFVTIVQHFNQDMVVKNVIHRINFRKQIYIYYATMYCDYDRSTATMVAVLNESDSIITFYVLFYNLFCSLFVTVD